MRVQIREHAEVAHRRSTSGGDDGRVGPETSMEPVGRKQAGHDVADGRNAQNHAIADLAEIENVRGVDDQNRKQPIAWQNARNYPTSAAMRRKHRGREEVARSPARDVSDDA